MHMTKSADEEYDNKQDYGVMIVDMARQRTENAKLYTEAQLAYGREIEFMAADAFFARDIYNSPREKFIAIKVASPKARDFTSIENLKFMRYIESQPNIKVKKQNRHIFFHITF